MGSIVSKMEKFTSYLIDFERYNSHAPEDIINRNSNQILKAVEKVQRLKAEADRVRAAIPEVSEKEYFWDVPFHPGMDIREASDKIDFSDGIYSEQEDFSEYAEQLLFEKTLECRAGDVLSYFLSDWDANILLYIDRKIIKSRLAETMTAREILCCADTSCFSENYEDDVLIDQKYQKMRAAERMMAEYNRLKRDRTFLLSKLPDDMARLNEKWDNIERAVNLSYWTNDERLASGMMTNDDYYDQSIWRDMDISNAESRLRQEVSETEYQMEKILKQQKQARDEYYGAVTEKAVRSLRTLTLDVIRCGKVFYSRNDIAAIIVYKKKQNVYEIRHKGSVTPYNIHGSFLNINNVDKRTPALKPLLNFIALRYASKLKPYNPLAARPKGAADDVWRYWMSLRQECDSFSQP